MGHDDTDLRDESVSPEDIQCQAVRPDLKRLKRDTSSGHSVAAERGAAVSAVGAHGPDAHAMAGARLQYSGSSARDFAVTLARRHKKGSLMGVAGAVIAIAALAYVFRPALPLPTVSDYKQLTNDAVPKGLVGTDGSRLIVGGATPSIAERQVPQPITADQSKKSPPHLPLRSALAPPDSGHKPAYSADGHAQHSGAFCLSLPPAQQLRQSGDRPPVQSRRPPANTNSDLRIPSEEDAKELMTETLKRPGSDGTNFIFSAHPDAAKRIRKNQSLA